MQFSPPLFNRLLSRGPGLGQAVQWRKAFTCPCRDPDSGAARPGCGQCSGRGWLWAAAVDAWAAVASAKAAREWTQLGEAESGDQVLSVPADSPLWAAGEYDRVVMVDGSEPFSLSLVRDAPDERLRYPTVQIDRVFWLSAGDAIVEGGIPVVAADGSLAWTAGAPPAGQQYSITGRRRPEFYVFRDLPQARATGGLALPRRIAFRRFDQFGRSGG